MKETLADEDIAVSQYEYDDTVELVADFGVQHDKHIEIVGKTALIIVDDAQYEIEFDGDAQAFINNGVVTIKVEE